MLETDAEADVAANGTMAAEELQAINDELKQIDKTLLLNGYDIPAESATHLTKSTSIDEKEDHSKETAKMTPQEVDAINSEIQELDKALLAYR